MTLGVPSIAVLTATAALLGFVIMRWPELGTLIAVGLLYLNVLPIAIRDHGLPPPVVAATALLLVPALFANGIPRPRSVRIDRTFLLMIGFLACLLMSSYLAVSTAPALRWIKIYLFEGMLLYLLVLNVVRSTGTLRRTTWVLVACGALLASLTMYQELTRSYTNDFGGLATRSVMRERERDLLDQDGRESRSRIKDVHRAQGPSLDANRYAQILIVLLPLCWSLGRHERRPAVKILAALCATVIVGGVLLTYSRGAFLGLAAMMMLMVVMGLASARQLLIAVGALALSIAVLSPGYLGRMETLRGVGGLLSPTTETDAGPDNSERGRAALMLAAWGVFRDHPILGTGPGQFASVYSIDYQSDLYSIHSVGRSTREFRAHSLYLELAAETGVVGLGVFIAVVALALRRLARARRQATAHDAAVADLAAGYLLATVTYLVTAVFLQLTYQRYYWLLLALGGATVQICESMTAKQLGAPPGVRHPA